MIEIMTNVYIAFSWFCLIVFGTYVLCWLDERNYWMPPIYVGWGAILFILTLIVNFISQEKT